MTRMEKETIIRALKYYESYSEKAEQEARENKDLKSAVFFTREKCMAGGLKLAFEDILSKKSGTCSI